jgi:FlaA1/EpsC-like NDP-sugar epimerase
MLKKYSQLFLTSLFLSDILIIALSWILSYYLRVGGYVIPVYKNVPPLSVYLPLTLYAVIIWTIALKVLGLYSPMRIVSLFEEATQIIKASLVAILILSTVVYFVKEYKYSRVVFFYFWVLSTTGLIISRSSLRAFLRYLRKKGLNLRFVLIVGAGELGQKVFRSINHHTELGLRVVGFLTRRKENWQPKFPVSPY